MKRRDFITATLAAPFLSLTARPALALGIGEIESYLNKFRSAKGKFVQANPDSTLSQGVFYMKKPGRIRFEYEAPNPALVISDGYTVGVFDKKSRRGPQQYPLVSTPLKILLQDRVQLQGSGMLKGGIQQSGPQHMITAIDPKNPRLGSIKMVFTANPTELRQWVVRDKAGRETTVIIGELNSGVAIDGTLFNLAKAKRQFGQ